MQLIQKIKKSAWSWIPSLYFAEGIPYIIVMFVATDMYKTLGISNASLAFWTSILYLPWVIKPLWSPFVDLYSTKRRWIVWMQIGLAITFFGVSLVLHLPWWFPLSLIFLWIMAIISATHDIAADGFYMLALDEHRQAFYTGIRSTFYRLAMIAGLGVLVIITGLILDNTGLDTLKLDVTAVQSENIDATFNIEDIEISQSDKTEILVYPEKLQVPLFKKGGSDSLELYIALSSPPEEGEKIDVNFGHKKGSKDIYLAGKSLFSFDENNWNQFQRTTIKVKPNLQKKASARFEAQSGDVAWSWSISISMLGFLFLLLALYHLFILPKPELDKQEKVENNREGYWAVFAGFFKKKGIVPAIIFLLLYRFAESQLSKMASPFLLDSKENGGLALSLTEKGFAYGTVGLVALLFGGIIGGIVASKNGLKKWIWWMAIAINLPNLVYVYLSYVKPGNLLIINSCIAIEQFGYGFGFTGYMLYMLYLAGQGKHKTAHFAIATGFMALGMMIPGMFSGSVQEFLGYQHFFIYVILCTIPSFLTILFIKIDPAFGLKKQNTNE